MKWLLLILPVLGSFCNAHATILKMDCVFADTELKDHVLIELHSEQRGTLYYSAETDEATAATPIDRLDLKRVDSSRDDTAKWQVNRAEVSLYYLMPANLLTRTSDSFKGSMITEIPSLNLNQEQALTCTSKY